MDECSVPEKMCFFCWCYYFYFLFQTLFSQFLFSLSISKVLSMNIYLPWHSSFLLNLLMAHFNFMRQLLCTNLFQKKGSIDDNGKGGKWRRRRDLLSIEKVGQMSSSFSSLLFFFPFIHSFFEYSECFFHNK